MQRIIFGLLIILIIAFSGCPQPNPVDPLVPMSAANSRANCGSYGMVCCAGDYPCSEGECNNGMCIHCGSFGEVCCNNKPNGIQCADGSDCVTGLCKVQYNYDRECGLVGNAPCERGGLSCTYGVVDSLNGICLACGDYEQPCCQYTSYPCDYGKCTVGYPHVGGICKRTNEDNTANNSQPINPVDDSTIPEESTTGGNCGHLNEACCQDPNRLSPMGALTAQPPCYTDLECYGNICVPGPSYEATPRP